MIAPTVPRVEQKAQTKLEVGEIEFVPTETERKEIAARVKLDLFRGPIIGRKFWRVFFLSLVVLWLLNAVSFYWGMPEYLIGPQTIAHRVIGWGIIFGVLFNFFVTECFYGGGKEINK